MSEEQPQVEIEISAPASEPEMEAPPLDGEAVEAVVEEVTDATVEIAGIEAERDVTLAAIAAETEREAIEARREEVAAIEEGIEAWREPLETIQTNMRELTERMDQLSAHQSTPPMLTEAALEVAEEVATEPEPETTSLLTLPGTSEPTSETVTEVTAESGSAEVEVTVRKRRVPI